MTDYRALCARMADELDHYRQLLMDDRRATHALAAEARAALNQPEPQGPTDEEIYKLALDGDFLVDVGDGFSCMVQDEVEFARAALARWGRPAIEPVPVSERLPGPEDCDEQGRCWLWERDCGYNGRKWALVDRAWSLSQSDEDLSVYTHWLPANAIPTPEAIND